VIEISGNEAGSLDGVYGMRQMMGGGSDMVTVILEKGASPADERTVVCVLMQCLGVILV
jgi:hypothetical protein